MKIRPVRTELFHVDERTERNDEANSRFSQFCELSQKLIQNITVEHNNISVRVLCYVSTTCFGSKRPQQTEV